MVRSHVRYPKKQAMKIKTASVATGSGPKASPEPAPHGTDARPDRSPLDAPGVAAVNRAIQILNAFDASSEGLSLTEIAKRTGFFKSTVLRISDSLTAAGLLERSKSGRFHLGRELIRLGVLARRTWGPTQYIQEALQRLTDSTGESATYYVQQGEGRLAMFRVDSPKSVRDSISAGDVLPLDRGAAGHVFTRAVPAEERFSVVISRGERDAEVAAVAGPVYSESRLIGALSVSGPRSRMTEARLRQIALMLGQVCEDLSAQLS